MNTDTQNTYGKPPMGCYLDHCNYNNFELSKEIISWAERFGMPSDPEINGLLQKLSDNLCDSEASTDDEEAINDYSEKCIDWLNDQETRSFMSWSNDGYANAFGLWADVDGAKDDVGFVSSKAQDYPDDDYEGEWLHVSDHGNATLYNRVQLPAMAGAPVSHENFRDVEIWSVV